MDYPEQYKMKNYNPLRVRSYRNMPERSGMWGRDGYDNRMMNRRDGMYDDGMRLSGELGRYNDNSGRYVNMPEVYSREGYDPSRSMNYKHSEMEDYDNSDKGIKR